MLVTAIPFLIMLAGWVATAEAACTTHAPVSEWDTCNSFAVTNGLHLHSLLKLNPSLDCTKPLPSRLCVADDTVKLPPTCGKWDEVQYDRHGSLNDSCTTLAVRNQISDIRYLMWINPHLDCRNLAAGELVCVQAQHHSAAPRQCINWEEIVGDGKTDPCAGKPAEMNTHMQCGKPLANGLAMMACTDAVEVPVVKSTCTRYKTFTVDGQTNYCLLKGGKENMPELVKHLQLNNHVYCSAGGTVGGAVMLCMEGYIESVEEDVASPGSPARDHLMLKLFKMLSTSPRRPSLDLDPSEDPFSGGKHHHTSTHGFKAATQKLPAGFAATAAGLIHLAGAAIQAYKAHGNQIMAQSAWGAINRAVALQDFSPDLFALQKSDAEFDRYVNHMLLTHKRDVTCRHLSSAAPTQPRFEAAARCFCDPLQHMMRCDTLFKIAMSQLQKDNPPPNPHPSATATFHRGSNPDSGVRVSSSAASTPAARKPAVKPVITTIITTQNRTLVSNNLTHDDQDILAQLTPEEREVAEKIAHALEMAAAKAVGADPDAGVMSAEELEKWHDSFKTPEKLRNLLQANTINTKVMDERISDGVEVILQAKNFACGKLKDLIKQGVDKLKKMLATCIVEYRGDVCDEDGGCLSVVCPAADFQIVSLYINITFCVAFPRDDWIRCRAGCEALELGYEKIYASEKELACPEACIRFLNDGYLDNNLAQIQLDVCLGGSALNLIKWLDELLPDWVEDALDIKWKNILCFTLMRGGLKFPTGLVYLTLLPLDWGILKTQLDFTLQAYRPFQYPEICDCNASPWACQPYCVTDPGDLTFSGYITVGFDINLWLFELDLSHTWSWAFGFGPCSCTHLPPKANALCPKGKGIAPPSTTCATCPAGMIAPNGGTCLACPAGSIPKSDRSNCLYCAKDYVAVQDGSSSCVKCGTGLNSFPVLGGRLCRGRCPPGKELIQSPPATSCTPCASGKFNPGKIVDRPTLWTGLCAKCPKGSYPNAQKSACLLCDPGYAATTAGQSQCYKCPSGYIPGDCQCKPYTYSNTAPMFAITDKALVALKASVAGGSAGASAVAGPAAATGTFSRYKTQWETRSLVADLYNNKTFAVPTGNSFVALSRGVSTLVRANLLCAKNYGCQSCKICPPGTYATPGSLVCTKCRPGYYQPKAGQSKCLVCPPGTAAKYPGSATCTSCPAGTYASGCRPKFIFKLLADFKGLIKGDLVGRRLAQAVEDDLAGADGDNLSKAFRSLQGLNAYVAQVDPTFKLPMISKIQDAQPTLNGCTECEACPYGTFSPKPNSTACTSCKAGQYQDQLGQASCNLCQPGFISPGPAMKKCFACNKGNFSACATGSLYCTEAFMSSGQTTCLPCASLVKDGLRNEQCADRCSVGWYRPPPNVVNGTVSPPYTCLPCPPGFVQDSASEQTACRPCPSGSSKPVFGAGTCQLCDRGYYNPLSGQGRCVKCPSPKTTTIRGATSKSQCK